MSKAVLVIDMPDSCRECDFQANNVRDNPICILCTESCAETYFTKDEYKRINTDLGEKPKWCPLKPLPEKMLKTGEGYVAGWNAAIDAIGGNDSDGE